LHKEQTHHHPPLSPPELNLVPGWEVCQPAFLEWQVGCVTQHWPTCICLTLESVLLHFHWSQVSLFSFTSSFSSVCTCHLKTEIWRSFKNMYLLIWKIDFKIAETFPLTGDEIFGQWEEVLVIQAEYKWRNVCENDP